MGTREIKKENLESTIKSGIVILDFWASWCGPCRAFAPIFEAAAEKHPDVVFGKVNTQVEQELAAAFNVRAIPTLVAFKDGVPVFMQPGALPSAALEELVTRLRDLDMEDVRRQLAETGT